MRQRIDSRALTGVALCILAALIAGCGGEAGKARHMRRAERYYMDERYKEAIIEYLNVLRLDPTNSLAIRQLGLAHSADGNARQAIPFILRSAQLEPDNTEVQLKAAQLYLLAGQAANSRQIAEQILARDPDNFDAHLLLVDSAREDEAVGSTLNRLLARAGKYEGKAVYHAALGALYVRRRNFEAAEKALKRAEELDPTSTRVHQALARIYQLQGDLESAETEYRTGAELDPGNTLARINLARFKVSAGDSASARSIIEAMIENMPGSVPALLELA